MKGLLIIVGSSGAGKSTLIEAMGVPADCHYVTCQPMIDELKRRGDTVNHDTIFALSEEWYAKDSFWQVPLILKTLEGKRLVVVDGPRRLPEVQRLKESESSIIIGIAVSPKNRFGWLKARGQVGLQTLEEFERLEEDETGVMDVGALMEMADLIIKNNVSKERLQQKGRRLAMILRWAGFLPKFFLLVLIKAAIQA